jgi:hypothetical protein
MKKKKKLDRVPLVICTSTQNDFSLYQVSSNSPKEVEGVAKTKYFSKKMLNHGAKIP